MNYLLWWNDYIKQTFSEKIDVGYTAHIIINGDSIGGTVEQGEWCTLLEEKIENVTNSSVEVTKSLYTSFLLLVRKSSKVSRKISTKFTNQIIFVI